MPHAATTAPDRTTTVVVAVAAQPCDRPIARPRPRRRRRRPDLVATAAHVVDGPRREVTVDGERGRVVAVDARTDLALLAADVDGSGADRRRSTRSTTARSARSTVTAPSTFVRTGRLVVHDTTDDARYEREVHTFTPGVEPGTSGAPLVDDDGRLAGIVVLANRTDGTAYAVTAAELRRLLAATPAPRLPSGAPTKVAAAGDSALDAGRLHETFLHSIPGTTWRRSP